MSATEARRHLGKLLDSLEQTDIVVERFGQPVAAVLSVAEYQRLNDKARSLDVSLTEAAESIFTPGDESQDADRAR